VPAPPEPLRFTMQNYYLNTSLPITPWGVNNPLYGQKRLSECICIFIQRTICDPGANDTACFSSNAQNLLMGLDFCCLTNTALTTAVDAISGLLEFSFHFANGADEFFLFVDR